MKKIILLLVATIISPSIHSMDRAPKKDGKHFVFHPDYDISFFGLEKFHPFDTCKYSKVADALVNQGILSWNDFHQPKEITDDELILVHTPNYVQQLRSQPSELFSRISGAETLGVPLHWAPNRLIDWVALYPMRLATGGTVKATELALKNGWAINLSGGYHHAKSYEGSKGGFCVYNDAAIAAYRAITEHNIERILVVDLDAHQGNGNEEIFGSQEVFKNKVTVLDMYNKDAYPLSQDERKHLTDQPMWYNLGINNLTTSLTYTNTLKEKLACAIKNTQPQLIIYNAGTDILAGDKIGGLNISRETILKRDKLVFEFAKDNNIPIVMMLSGGYTSESAKIISDSIKNIFTKVMNKNMLPYTLDKRIRRMISYVPFKTIILISLAGLLYTHSGLNNLNIYSRS